MERIPCNRIIVPLGESKFEYVILADNLNPSNEFIVISFLFTSELLLAEISLWLTLRLRLIKLTTGFLISVIYLGTKK